MKWSNKNKILINNMHPITIIIVMKKLILMTQINKYLLQTMLNKTQFQRNSEKKLKTIILIAKRTIKHLSILLMKSLERLYNKIILQIKEKSDNNIFLKVELYMKANG